MPSVTAILCLCFLLTVPVCNVQIVTAEPGIIRVPAHYPTIKQALEAALPGDTIIVSEGVYAEGEIWITKSNLTLMADGAVVVDGEREARWVFYIQGTSNITIRGFTVINSQVSHDNAGICLDHAQNCTIENNTATNNAYGILLYYSSHNTLINNTASFNDGYGIELDASPNNTLIGNLVTDNFFEGICVGAYNNVLLNNTAIHNHYSGIAVVGSNGNVLIGNSAINNTSSGIALGGDGASILSNNNMTGNTYNLAIGGDLYGNEIDVTNFVDGRRVYYLKNQQGLIIDPSTFPDVGCLAVIKSTRITVKNITITNNWKGILFAEVTNSTIENVNVAKNGNGIHLLTSHGNTLKGNTAMTNNMCGIYLSGSRHNNVTGNIAICNDIGILVGSGDHNYICNNIVMNGTIAGFDGTSAGIYVDSSDNNTIKGNTVANNLETSWGGGIALVSSDNNLVHENTMVNNKWGVFLVYSKGTIIYHNNFFANIQEALSSDSTSIWDNGYPSGGNYWSDYNGTDLYRGSFQNVTGSDGIGDTPHIIPDLFIEEGQDSYPLAKPYGGPHDLGITASVSRKTIIAEGYYMSVTMNVTIINYGIQTETFNFTLQIGATIQSQTLTLAYRNSTTFTFTFNTTGLPIGIYLLSVYVTPVIGETYTADNSHTTQIIMTTPGDVDGDFDVDLYDAVKLLARYEAKEGAQEYNPDCDIDSDGQISLYDAVILLAHYGQKPP